MDEAIVSDKTLTDNYLSLFKITNNKYIIGVFHPGITVYKQQIRALNIFHVLVKSGTVDISKKNFKIGIIGAGVAGLTFAAAAAKIGAQVVLFEKRAIYMPMQYGCDTRVVHPNIYDWPSKRSTFPYAEVPILQWRADTAAKISKQIVTGFLNIMKESPDMISKLRTEISKIEDVANGQIKIRYNTDGDVETSTVDLLIFAIGYGVEKGVDSAAQTPSYWRNDDYAQPVLSKGSKHYFISGIGDGGLLDLFRTKIRGFNIDSFLQEISCYPGHDVLMEKILEIKEKWKGSKERDKLQKSWLHDQFEEINKDLYRPILEKYLLLRIRKNCQVTVHGKEKEFADNLNLDKISMFNAFVVFLISRNTEFFSYEHGRFDSKDGHYTLNGKRIRGTVLIRQGTDRMGFTKEKGLLTASEKKQVRKLESEQKGDKFYNTTNLLFPYSSLHALLSSNPHKKFSFLTPETSSICSSFVAVLSNALKFHQINKYQGKKFRVCLHRVIKDGYQQVTPYYGDTDYTGSISVGRVHGFDRGIVGLSIQTGKPIQIENKATEPGQPSFTDLISGLKLDTKAKQHGNSALAIPVLGHTKNSDLCVNLVCFLESNDPKFFSDLNLVVLIVYAIEGFMNYINSSINKQITMTEIDFEPIKINDKLDFNGLKMNPCLTDISEKLDDLSPPNTPLKFENFNSFDITYSEMVDYLHQKQDG